MQLKNLVEKSLETSVSSVASYNTTGVNIGNSDRLAIQLVVAAETGTVSAQLQKSLDNVNWKNETSVTNQDLVIASIGSAGTFWLEKANPKAKFYRIAYTITAGSLTVSSSFLGKGSD